MGANARAQRGHSVPFRLGQWVVDPTVNELQNEGEILRIEPKVMEVLCCLAEVPGQIVSKQAFMEQVWEGAVVTDDVLARCISELRKLLSDDPRNPSYIETIRKKGYRLIAPVTWEEEATVTAVAVVTDDVNLPPSYVSWLVEEVGRAVGSMHRGWIRVGPVRLSGTGLLLASLGLAVVLVGIGQILRPRTVEPPSALPFTTFPGQEFDPDLSPDGEHIAFAWDNGSGAADVYIKQMGAETPLRITEDPADERSPAWSPDGRSLAFIRKSKDQQQIIMVPAIGGSERILANFGESEVQRLIWSPDGLSMAVSAQDTAYGAFSIFLLSNETLEKRRLTFPPAYAQGDQDPSFSADGKRLAFVRVLTDQVQDLYVVSTQGGEPVRQTFDYEAITGLDWSSEGEDIVFASGRGGTSNLWRLPGKGGKPRWIAAAGDAAIVHHPSVSRTNGRLTYVRYSSNTNIWKYDRAGPPRSLISSTRWDSNPSISPDGEHIAFVSRRSGTLEVWMCDQEGNFPIQLTSNQGGVASTPRWSPDGGRVAYTYWQEGNADIKVIDVAGGKPHTLIDWPSHEVGASWSRDGLWVYFASNRGGSWQIWKISSEGGQAYQVTREGGITAFDGGEGNLYYVKGRTPGIWRMPIEGGQETLVIASLHPEDAANWQVVDRGIYFIRRDASGPAIAFYSFITEKTLRTAVLDQVPHNAAFSVSADRQWFLFSKTEQPESDILLIEDIR